MYGRNKKLIWVAGVPLIILIYILGLYVPPAIRQENLENKFSQLEKDLDDLSNEIKIAIPDIQLEKKMYCADYSQVWSDGPLHCDVKLSSKNIPSKEITELIRVTNIQHINWAQVIEPDINEKPYTIGEYINKNTDIECRLHLSDAQDTRFDFEFYCSELSNRSFYPYKPN